jgi:hypothetical protein
MSGLQASSSDFFLKEGGQYHELGCCARGIFLWALVDTPWLRESLSLCICWQPLKVVSKNVSVIICTQNKKSAAPIAAVTLSATILPALS